MNNNLRKGILGLVIVFAIGAASYHLYRYYTNLDDIHKDDEINDNFKPTEPKFVKEGELLFLNSEDSSQISKINIEISETFDERMQGLMHRSFMKENNGMLFIFDIQKMQAFWMKNTIISLDIIYVSKDFEIVSIAKNAVPYSTKSLPSTGPALYVVETVAGYCDKYDITAGDRISYTRL